MRRKRPADLSVAAVVPAAGSGSRLGAGLPKPYRRFGGRSLLGWTLKALMKARAFDRVVVSVDPRMRHRARRLLDREGFKGVELVEGASTRAASVRNAVLSLPESIDLVLIHDAARPLVDVGTVRRTVDAAARWGASLCVLGITSTVKRSRDGGHTVSATEERSQLYLAQTPQVFRRTLLWRRYAEIGERVHQATDEAALFDGTSTRVRIVEGNERNLKVTTPEDWRRMRREMDKK